MNKLSRNKSGFSAIEGLLILIVVILIGSTGYYVLRTKNTNSPGNTNSTSTTTTPKVDPNAGYLVVQEWGVRFKVPSGLADVQYNIFSSTETGTGDDTLAFYAKPANHDVQYVSEYKSLSGSTPKYALGVLYRSTSATKDKMSSTVTGKQLGNYYYYTAWAFNSLATGAACVGLYNGNSDSGCAAEALVFPLVNQGDTALINTIEPVQ